MSARWKKNLTSRGRRESGEGAQVFAENRRRVRRRPASWREGRPEREEAREREGETAGEGERKGERGREGGREKRGREAGERERAGERKPFLLPPLLATETISVARRGEEREGGGRGREKGERGREGGREKRGREAGEGERREREGGRRERERERERGSLSSSHLFSRRKQFPSRGDIAIATTKKGTSQACRPIGKIKRLKRRKRNTSQKQTRQHHSRLTQSPVSGMTVSAFSI